MSERGGTESTLAITARFCMALSIIILTVAINIQGCAIRDLQRRVGQLEEPQR